MKTTEIKVIQTEEVLVASVRVKCKPTEIGKELRSILPAIAQYLAATGTPSAGQPFTRYHAFEDGEVDLEAGIPVVRAIKPKGRIKPGKLPALKAAMTWHIGPYEKLQSSHDKVDKWIESKGMKAGDGMWEIYWTDPGLEPDPSKLQTQIFHPIAEK